MFSTKQLTFCFVGNSLMVLRIVLLNPKTNNSYSYCGFQVVDPTVAWILPRVGPTIRRGHRFVSYCATVFVCIPKLLAVVVSLKNYADPLLYMSDKKKMR